jgi:hypothetical protein
VLIVLRALRFLGGIVIDAGNRDGTAIRVDPNGVAPILKLVLRLRGAARQQKHGNSQYPLHHDLHNRLIPGMNLRRHHVG